MTKSHKTFCLVSVLKKGQNPIPNTCESSQLLAWHSDFLKDNSNRIKFYLVVFVNTYFHKSSLSNQDRISPYNINTDKQ